MAKLICLSRNPPVRSSDCWKLSIPACLYVVQNNVSVILLPVLLT